MTAEQLAKIERRLATGYKACGCEACSQTSSICPADASVALQDVEELCSALRDTLAERDEAYVMVARSEEALSRAARRYVDLLAAVDDVRSRKYV